jgi:AcrR family transcriptional regulator
MASPKRDHLVATALVLFNRDGFHATGIDKILAEAGVAKMTLYKHFKSKDELILAVLRRRDEEFRNWFMRAVEARAKTPRARLLAVFDAIAEWFDGRDFSGCMFINASAEFAEADDPIHGAAAEHKRLILGYLREQAEAAGADDASTLAMELMLLMEGAIVMAYVAGETDSAARAKAAARTLLKAAGL